MVWGKYVLVAGLACTAGTVQAGKVGELHRRATTPTASVRDAESRPDLRITVWYPAADSATEEPLLVGPHDKPLFDAGNAAADAPFDTKRHPVLLVSHGFGGSARMMAWFGTAMARAGYVVIAVDHPGNNGMDTMTAAGAALWWERPEDLRAALGAIGKDPSIEPHLDLGRVGAAGFSAGGFTSLVEAGARIDVARFDRFCKTTPKDPICLPQKEALELDASKRSAVFATPEMAAMEKHAGDDHSIAQVRAVFAIAPGLVQALDPDSLRHMRAPVEIVLGDADPVAPPATNGLVAAKLIPGATLKVLPRVGHYDFLATCTDAGRALVALCADTVSQDATHKQAIDAATAFFARTLTPH
jgi:predicted dienelactone hydrolase